MSSITKTDNPVARILSIGASLGLLATMALGVTGVAAASDSISVAVTANKASPVGLAIFQGAQLAAEEINANGGIDGRTLELDPYRTHASSAQAVRGFQHAAQSADDVAVIGSYISEVSLALEPWAARLKMPYLITGAASTKIPEAIRQHPEQYKYTFQATFNSTFWAKSVCAYARDILADQLGYQTAVVISEDAAWTLPMIKEYKECLPKAGLEIVNSIKFSPDTRDFTPVFSKAQRHDPDVMIVNLAHTGVKPTVQWRQQQVPMLMAGMNVQAQAGTFWDATHGATEGVVTVDLGAGKAALTPKTQNFYNAYVKRFGESPMFDAYTTYDAVYLIKQAIEQTGSTDADGIVDALEKMEYEGTTGQIAFYGADEPYAHAMKFGPDYVTGIAEQWQAGKQEVIWPAKAASAKVILPDFVRDATN